MTVDPSADRIEEAVGQQLAPVLELRRGVSVPPLSEGPVAVLQRLVEVRARLDRVEECLSNLLRLRGSARRAAAAAKDEADDAWATRITATGGRPRRGDFGEAAPRERYAEADLATLQVRRRARLLAEKLSRVEEAVEVARLAHGGLADLRRDLHVVLRAMEVEHSLER